MTTQGFVRTRRAGKALLLCAAMLAGALVAGCGGASGPLAHDETADQQREREKAALQRALELNHKTLAAARVKGERASQR